MGRPNSLQPALKRSSCERIVCRRKGGQRVDQMNQGGVAATKRRVWYGWAVRKRRRSPFGRVGCSVFALVLEGCWMRGWCRRVSDLYRFRMGRVAGNDTHQRAVGRASGSDWPCQTHARAMAERTSAATILLEAKVSTPKGSNNTPKKSGARLWDPGFRAIASSVPSTRSCSEVVRLPGPGSCVGGSKLG